MEASEKELKALINLLDDPDDEIYQLIKNKFLSLGQEIVPVLENVWETGDSFNHIVQTRIENIIHQIQFDSISFELSDWASNGGKDLLEGAILVAKYQYPDLNVDKLKNKIEQIIQDVWLEVNENLTALEKVKVLNHVLYDVHGFSGNTANFHAPQNSYLNNVLESKKGNPLSLSILYAVVSQRLEIPIYGVNLPQHFILAYTGTETTVNLDGYQEKEVVLFYVNPFSRGAIFNKKEIDLFLKQLGIEPIPMFYEPCSNVEIIRRLLKNLIFSYEKLGYPNKTEELNELYNSLGPFPQKA
jgi:regulator of sirC expression with transglutaminase-like and TPR domain